ncbi:MAG: type II toxin-antitoxin system RelE/ParE family toxin [Deltaproteobacteria bacterium]|nr:type II toxin-antitoxin system RelE/ParE family toxin [Deltaproteobacteria bacterium]
MAYNISYKASIEKDLKRLDRPTISRILKKLEQVLGNDPSAGEPLVGEFKGCFKYRVGDYRIIYTKTMDGILVLRIGHRKEIYR